jgi:Tn3 transposase DDE domain
MTISNTLSSSAAKQEIPTLRAQGAAVPDDLLAHVAPLGWEHIGLTGDYVWTDANPVSAATGDSLYVPVVPENHVRA